MYTLTLRLPDDLEPRIRDQAYRDRVSVNKFVTYAVLEWLDRKEAERETAESA